MNSRPRARRANALVLLGVLALAACTTPAVPPISEAPPPSRERAEYRIGPGDSLSVKLFYNSELNEDLAVRPDGRISLQLIGEVDALGRTPGDLSRHIAQRYAYHVDRPDAVVIVRGFANQRAFVGGEVRNPRMVPLEGQLSIRDAVVAAGGTLDTAETSSVILIRRGEGGREAYRVDIGRGFAGTEDATLLRPYDVVFVPKSFIAQVGTYVDLYINRIIPRNATFMTVYQTKDFPTTTTVNTVP